MYTQKTRDLKARKVRFSSIQICTELTVGDESSLVNFVLDYISPEDQTVFTVVRMIVVEIKCNGVAKSRHQRDIGLRVHVKSSNLVAVREDNIGLDIICKIIRAESSFATLAQSVGYVQPVHIRE